ncbi:hypothetical protein DCC39_15700 [Pueribacillus theae]|uniref:Uncharacterized protein n=1 Tax=Pueribacillus theae TaxID=2171751 RepID=A0A2U1JT61_9BACI|nr:hypothetical protein [Pueribacillus theae]PWA08008.1 hypothetical protein DCC39_15700 [Pueribacillus theae]
MDIKRAKKGNDEAFEQVTDSVRKMKCLLMLNKVALPAVQPSARPPLQDIEISKSPITLKLPFLREVFFFEQKGK